MNCAVCGAARDADDRFCRSCGCRFPHAGPGHAGAAGGRGAALPADARRVRRTARRLKVLAASVVAAALVMAVLVQAAPGLFQLVSQRPDDLGVTWSEQDYQAVMAKCAVTVDDAPEGRDRGKIRTVFSGSQSVDWTLTDRELTALLNGGKKPGYWPIGGIQVRIYGDNVFEAACMVDPAKLMTYPAVVRYLPKEVANYIAGIPFAIPVHVKARIKAAGPKQADVEILSLEASGMSMGGMAANEQANQIVGSIANELLNEAAPVGIESLTTEDGALHVRGTWFTEMRREPAE